MKFTVRIAEIHYSYRDVEAKTWREAVQKARDALCDGSKEVHEIVPIARINLSESENEEKCSVCNAVFEVHGYTIGCPGCLKHEHSD